VGYNWFESNEEHAVRIVPLLSAVGRIANNTFVNHSRYVLLLDNGDDLLDERYYQSALVRYQVYNIRSVSYTGSRHPIPGDRAPAVTMTGWHVSLH